MKLIERASWIFHEADQIAGIFAAGGGVDLVAVKFRLKSLLTEAQHLHDEISVELAGRRPIATRKNQPASR